MIQKLYDIGLITKVIISDMSGANLGLQVEFQIYVNGSPGDYTPSIKNTTLVDVVPTTPDEERSALLEPFKIEHTKEKMNAVTQLEIGWVWITFKQEFEILGGKLP